jgi:HEPN domain-containing protein
LPRKTDANNPADWLWMAETDLGVVRLAVEHRIGFTTCRSKLAEVLERLLKAELIRSGWTLEKTHDLDRLLDALVARQSDLVSLVAPLCDVLAEVYFTDRYPGFDLDDPDWPALRTQIEQVSQLLGRVRGKLAPMT